MVKSVKTSNQIKLLNNTHISTISNIIESINDHFLILDAEWNFVFANKNVAALLGKKPEEIAGKNMWQVFHFLTGTYVEEKFRLVMESKKSCSFEMKGIYADKVYYITAAPYENGIIVIANHISEKKIGSDQRKKNNHHPLPPVSLVDIFQVVEMIYDQSGKPCDYIIKAVNPRFEEIVRKNSYEIIGKSAREVFGTVEMYWIDAFDIVQRTGNPQHFRNFGSAFGKWFEVYAWKYDEKNVAAIITDVSEKRKLEVELQSEEQHLLAILKNSSNVIYCISKTTGKIEYISPSCETIFGFSPAEFMTMNTESVLTMIHPDHQHIVRRTIQECEEKGEASAEYLQRAKNGEYIWIQNKMSISRNVDGVIYRYGNVSDINDFKKNEEALTASNRLATERLDEIENLYKTVPIGLCVFDMDLRYVRINDRLAEINGIPAEHHIGKHISEIVPSLVQTAESIVKKITESGQPELGIEFTGITPAQPGRLRSWSEDWVPVKNNLGIITGVSVSVIETTNEKEAKKALEQSQQKLQMLLENGRIGIWERDLKTGEIFWDNRTHEIFGFVPGTFDGNLTTFRNCLNEDDIQNIAPIIEESIKTGKSFEVVYRTKPVKDESNYIAEKGFIIKDDNGIPCRLMGICFDVSDMKRGAEKVIMKMNEELLRSNRELQQFAYVASHDLQEPLRMVSSFTQLLQHKYHDKLDQAANEYINFAVEGSKRMYELLNGLLTYSRVQSRGADFRLIDTNRIIEKVKDNLRLVIERTGAKIDSSNLPGVTGDENQMVQLFQNLIDNAIKFNEKKPIILISHKLNDDYHHFSVRDNGIGIEPQYFERIFRIFQRLHTSNVYQGTGIGLSICQRIVERHGGSIWVESKIGEGSVFSFSVPAGKPMQKIEE